MYACPDHRIMNRTRFCAMLFGLAGVLSCETPLSPPVPEPLLYEAVAAGTSHTCALVAGQPYCWGRGGVGTPGIDTLHSLSVPTQVAAAGSSYTTISAYGDRTCALSASAQLYCWGAGEDGALGNGQNIEKLTPTLVPGSLAFSSVAPGGDHTCAQTPSGDVFCWGRGDHGQLGTGALTNTPLPGTRVGYDHKYRMISSGASHTCGVTTDGVLRCWGVNNKGQLGNATTVTLSQPELVNSELRFTAISAGSEHSCALSTAKTIYCWGAGINGQLGNGTLGIQLSPVPVAGNLAFVSVTAGGQHTCALTEDGRALCWGSNSDGQVGTGVFGGVQPDPAEVAGNLRFRQLSAGESHTCGVTTTGQIACWGYGGFGQIGNGFTLNQATPTRVAR